MAVNKLPEDSTETFRLATTRTSEQLTVLDIRLGVEQVVDTDSYFEEAQTYWNESGESPVLDASQMEAFRSVNPRVGLLSNQEIAAGMDALLEDGSFQAFCHDRWVRLGRLPEDEVVVDLGAMPDGV